MDLKAVGKQYCVYLVLDPFIVVRSGMHVYLLSCMSDIQVSFIHLHVCTRSSRPSLLKTMSTSVPLTSHPFSLPVFSSHAYPQSELDTRHLHSNHHFTFHPTSPLTLLSPSPPSSGATHSSYTRLISRTSRWRMILCCRVRSWIVRVLGLDALASMGKARGRVR